jgi:CoA:oxalate CoA-transferase
MMKKPLEGIRVLDLTRILSGPYCTMMLGDLGADIIKVEPWPDGDDSRGNPPFVKEESMYYVSLNRGKRSIVMNLKEEGGKETFRRMISDVDVLIENFRPGAMARLGLNYETLKPLNPKLVYCAVSGFGQTGPYKDRAAYDAVIQAMGGIMSVTGQAGGSPTRVGTSIGDISAGLFATIGILGALRVVEHGGAGQFIDISMLDCQVAIVEGQIARYFGTGKVPQSVGNRHATATPFDMFKTKDGHIIIAVQKNSMWEKLCQSMGLEHLVHDPRFATNAVRCDNEASLKAILEPVLQQKTTGEWMDIFVAANVACGPLNNIADVIADPHILSRDMIVEVPGHAKLGAVKYPGHPIKYSETRCSIERPAPVLGQHTDEILMQFGFTSSDINCLIDGGSVK